jgi:hypothetical protein
MATTKIYERVDNKVYSRLFGGEPSSRVLEYVINSNQTDWDRFDKIVKQIMAASDANLQV